MTATEGLRRLLDERGVEWDELVGHPVVVGTAWYDRDGYPCTALEHADDVPDGILSVQANLTPAQAVEATLGRGTCRIEKRHMDWRCTGCGEIVGTDDPTSELFIDGNAVELWRYCPNCGAKVVDA